MRICSVLLAFFSPLLSFCQFNNNETFKEASETMSGYTSLDRATFKKNAIKVNFAPILLNNYSIAFERTIKKNFSALIEYRYGPYQIMGKSIVGKRISKLKDIEESVLSEINDFSSGNYAITGELRFYTGSRKRLFVGIYGRYAGFDLDNMNYHFESSDKSFYVPFIINATGIGGGLLIGRKYWIGKKISIETFIAGAHYGKLHGSLISKADLSSFSEADKKELKNELETKFTILHKKLISIESVNDDGLTGNVNGPFMGLRAALTIGYNF